MPPKKGPATAAPGQGRGGLRRVCGRDWDGGTAPRAPHAGLSASIPPDFGARPTVSERRRRPKKKGLSNLARAAMGRRIWQGTVSRPAAGHNAMRWQLRYSAIPRGGDIWKVYYYISNTRPSDDMRFPLGTLNSSPTRHTNTRQQAWAFQRMVVRSAHW